jgi:hypothetical protein
MWVAEVVDWQWTIGSHSPGTGSNDLQYDISKKIQESRVVSANGNIEGLEPQVWVTMGTLSQQWATGNRSQQALKALGGVMYLK